MYIKSGSDINLTCVVLQTPEPPSFIYWYHGGHVINYSQRGGISVVTEKQTRTSRLLISRAAANDSGNYTCAPSSSDSASVSWIRKRDLHILTVGILTYTNDQRFQSLHSDGSDEWTLKVSSPQVRDSGTYECQVSTEPKISMAFKLNVVGEYTRRRNTQGVRSFLSKAKIQANSELYIKSGSDINLTCVVLQTPEPPSFIYWYHGGHVINYSQRGGISVVTEKQTRTSRLLISRAAANDSGNYTCAPSSSDSASVLVHVLNVFTSIAKVA
ncbi:hypothetical protein J437_LFUL000745 [Ladona fulva]|uniref:Ig-like domain-containing protein n=1 Tax=Ladona fulva TaxID=123851 RepID=A0A8K0JTW8_LADFU|nr:hypothetical protein J437_LFUL000745 [Ladona fulva]